jgi:hypothetical protein
LRRRRLRLLRLLLLGRLLIVRLLWLLGRRLLLLLLRRLLGARLTTIDTGGTMDRLIRLRRRSRSRGCSSRRIVGMLL